MAGILKRIENRIHHKFAAAVLLFFIAVTSLPAKGNDPKATYVETYKDAAIREMKEFGIPASITLAQGILESASGKSALARRANNHFGIKCHSGWTGGRMYRDDDKKGECFRSYNNVEESYRDHSLFLSERGRYAFLFDLEPTDYEGWAKGLKKAGYATDPNYPRRLIKIIEDYELYRYDLEGVKGGKGKSKKIVMRHSNDIKYVIADEGDDIAGLSEELDVAEWRLLKYNELEEDDTISAGDIIFLQPKRRKSYSPPYTVKEGEDMYYISQKFGVKLKHLYRKNRMEPGEEPQPGTKIWLRKKKTQQ